MKARTLITGLAVCVLIGVVLHQLRADYFRGESTTFRSLEPSLTTDSDHGIAYFAFGDWGSLDSDALRISASPWKLSIAAIALQQMQGELDRISNFNLADTFRQYGFHSPASFGNWPAHLPQPELQSPLGQNIGLAKSTLLPISAMLGNIGCAACHSSVMYNADGSPDLDRVWLGMPNGSINLEAYTSAIFTAMRDFGDTDKLMQTVDILFPDTSWSERLTLKYFILPEFKQVVETRNEALGRLLPFRASLAGATNGLDSLKRRLGLISDNEVLTQSIFNSVPDLGGRLWRNKLLNSGSYAIPDQPFVRKIQKHNIDTAHRQGLAGIIAFFTVPSMGVTTNVAEQHIDDALAITAWMQDYQTQNFPGTINRTLLPLGRKVYENHCVECHGEYSDDLQKPELISFPNWEGNLGTDIQRAALLTQEVADAVNTSLFGQYISARTVTGYSAPPLSGIWSSAPYFHNGSVPTLWHLMNPEQRPTRFQVGGHHLDMEKVGLAGLSDGSGGWLPLHEPWSIPAMVNTEDFGLSNTGHEQPFDTMSDGDKKALLEYLKLL